MAPDPPGRLGGRDGGRLLMSNSRPRFLSIPRSLVVGMVMATLLLLGVNVAAEADVAVNSERDRSHVRTRVAVKRQEATRGGQVSGGADQAEGWRRRTRREAGRLWRLVGRTVGRSRPRAMSRTSCGVIRQVTSVSPRSASPATPQSPKTSRSTPPSAATSAPTAVPHRNVPRPTPPHPPHPTPRPHRPHRDHPTPNCSCPPNNSSTPWSHHPG